jgi:hypothetical protein
MEGSVGVDEEVARGWEEHAEAPERVAAALPDLVARAAPEQRERLAALLFHVLVEHLDRGDEARALLDELLGPVPPEGVDLPQWWVRCRAALHLLAAEQDEATRLIRAASGEPPDGRSMAAATEAWACALAAGASAERGRIGEAGDRMKQAASLAFSLRDQEPALRAIAATANNLAAKLEVADLRAPRVAEVLRAASTLARVAWERAGTWRNVAWAEYRHALTGLALDEPYGAVTRAEACRAICEANGADAFPLAFAWEVVARARARLGDVAGAKAARESLAALIPQVPAEDREPVSQALAGVDRVLSAVR